VKYCKYNVGSTTFTYVENMIVVHVKKIHRPTKCLEYHETLDA
jgi:hypothetical protein